MNKMKKRKRAGWKASNALAWNNPDSRTAYCNTAFQKTLFSFEWDLTFLNHQFKDIQLELLSNLEEGISHSCLQMNFMDIFSERDKHITTGLKWTSMLWAICAHCVFRRSAVSVEDLNCRPTEEPVCRNRCMFSWPVFISANTTQCCAVE